MNQILSVEDNSNKKKKQKKEKTKNKNSGPIEITNILKFFSIAILIFGVFMIGTGSYSMYKDSQNEVSNVKPTISVEQIQENQLKLKVTHNKELSSVKYNWNDEEDNEIGTNGKKTVEETIDIPTGSNILNITATDINGQVSTSQTTYTLQGDITIDITQEEDGNNIVITAIGKEQLSYMTYRWDDEEETKVDINDIETEQIIETKKGIHQLTVIVVDINNNTETKEMEIQGVTKPKLEITTDGSSNFIINASDEQGLKKIEFKINEQPYVLNLDGRTELEYQYPLVDGENLLDVTVYNQSDVMTNKKVIVRK